MYRDALQGIRVSSLWKTHFNGPPAKGIEPIQPDSMAAVQHSVLTGAIAHIQGDMPVALAASYKTWEANPKPAFQP